MVDWVHGDKECRSNHHMAEEKVGSKSQIHTDIYTARLAEREVGDASSASPIKLAFSLGGRANDFANL